MNIFGALFLGIIQGLTEFFPVSSSGHLVAVPYIFNFSDPGLAFDIALHAGTFFAILAALSPDWTELIRSIFDKKKIFERKLIVFLLITTIPGALAGYFFEEQAKSTFRNPLLIAGTLAVFGLILWAVDKYLNKSEKIEKMTSGRSFIIGASQAIALIPGVSRSGATITAGRALGFSREATVKYSFLAAAPIILGATVFGLRDVSSSDFLSVNWIVGFGAAFVSSFWAIRFLTNYVKTHNFNVFLWWRIGLAILITTLYFWR